MGQYYAPVTVKGNEVTVYSLQGKKFRETKDFDYYNGIKLMEHSYLKNPAMVAIGNSIYKNPKKVYWVGDYASSYIDDLKDSMFPNPRLTYEEAMDAYDKAYGGKSAEYDYEKKYDTNAAISFYSNKLLVNHTKDEYIVYSRIKEGRYGFKINPLSLLTAIGNGYGGGDYVGINKNMAGYWAGDEISVEDASYINESNKDIITDVTEDLIFME